jgi:hypothetical protein
MTGADSTFLWIKKRENQEKSLGEKKTLYLCNVFIKDQPKPMKEETERKLEEGKKVGTAAAQKTKKAQDETIMKNLPQNVEWIKQPYALSVMRGDLSLTQTHIMVELMGALQVKINDFIAIQVINDVRIKYQIKTCFNDDGELLGLFVFCQKDETIIN